mmetsp:Transcript_91151/g.294517  ORF Transcript_91151/g.294517 Transcript_91151/m.294517 type:complete len:389 (+) Transcript_91151:1767-2933(+)
MSLLVPSASTISVLCLSPRCVPPESAMRGKPWALVPWETFDSNRLPTMDADAAAVCDRALVPPPKAASAEDLLDESRADAPGEAGAAAAATGADASGEAAAEGGDAGTEVASEGGGALRASAGPELRLAPPAPTVLSTRRLPRGVLVVEDGRLEGPLDTVRPASLSLPEPRGVVAAGVLAPPVEAPTAEGAPGPVAPVVLLRAEAEASVGLEEDAVEPTEVADFVPPLAPAPVAGTCDAFGRAGADAEAPPPTLLPPGPAAALAAAAATATALADALLLGRFTAAAGPPDRNVADTAPVGLLGELKLEPFSPEGAAALATMLPMLPPPRPGAGVRLPWELPRGSAAAVAFARATARVDAAAGTFRILCRNQCRNGSPGGAVPGAALPT